MSNHRRIYNAFYFCITLGFIALVLGLLGYYLLNELGIHRWNRRLADWVIVSGCELLIGALACSSIEWLEELKFKRCVRRSQSQSSKSELN